MARVGIDLGTTNSVVAVMDGPRPRVIHSREGQPQIRSVVTLRRRRKKQGAPPEQDTEMLAGDAAFDNWGMAPKDTILSVKRLMGRGVSDPEVQRLQEWALYKIVAPTYGTEDGLRVIMGEQEYSPTDISAEILRKVKEDAGYRMGEEVTHAVITVPAYFSQIQRAATRRAGLKAGLKVIKVLDEPTAAAIAFGSEWTDDEPKTLLVYDLGGGTFDVSLLMVAGNVFAPLNLEGDMWLGGDDLDQVIVDHVLRWIRDEFDIDPTSDDRFMAKLRRNAQETKERLSASSSADIILPQALRDEDGNDLDIDVEITREEFERMILPLVGRYRECICRAPNFAYADACAKCGRHIGDRPVKDGRAIQIVRKALKNAKQTEEQIDHVLMAGNSTTVPLVQQSMEEFFGAEKVMRKVHPKQSVALGAAIAAVWVGEVGEDKIVCQAPDPTDPSRECGELNDEDAPVCAKCGAPLQLEPEEEPPISPGGPVTIPEPTPDGPARKGKGKIGDIAPYHYGTQTAGDVFNLFVTKGDPLPTENPQTQTFYTRAPNQRMVSIPVYGGDDLEAASTNVLQGEAFALLPPDLPAESPVRIKLSIDGNQDFGISSYLADGTNLDPWVVTRGEADAAAIKGLERLEELMAKQADEMSPTAMRDLEDGRDVALEQMRQRDFEGAIRQVQAVEKEAKEVVPDDELELLRQKAENLITFAQFVLHQYSWAFKDDPAKVAQLTKLIDETKEALAEGDDARLQQRVAALDQATDRLPQTVTVFLTLKTAIASKIQPQEPVQAATLMAELDEIEEAFKVGDMAAIVKLQALAKKIGEWEGPERDTDKCDICGAERFGQRICPNCGQDRLILEAKSDR